MCKIFLRGVEMLVVENVSHGFGARTILENVSFRLRKGEHIALVGANGEGKSTLFKILTRELSQDDGEVFIDKNKSLGYLSQHLDLESCNSIYDEMLLVFEDLQRLEKKIQDLEEKMNEKLIIMKK